MADETKLTTVELAKLLDIPTSRLDHWVRAGALPSSYGPHPGSGVVRRWSPDEVRLARLFATMARAGVDIWAISAALPTALVGNGRFSVQLGPLVVTGPLS